jgi:hypothetical protein
MPAMLLGDNHSSLSTTTISPYVGNFNCRWLGVLIWSDLSTPSRIEGCFFAKAGVPEGDSRPSAFVVSELR